MNAPLDGPTVRFGAFQLALEVEPVFDRLRSDRRLAALLERVGLPR